MSEFIVETIGMLESNCYLVFIDTSRRLYIIDPGSEPETIVAATKKFDYDEAVILLTHAHVDHIGATRPVMDELGVKHVYLHRLDVPLYNSPDNHLMPFVPLSKNLPLTSPEIPLPDFELLETPGHTRGGVCFYFKQLPALFSGDTLFAGSIGRTDLPGGDTAALLKFIKEKIMTLPDELRICPGHGPSTTVSKEKRGNPFLAGR
ncbi:MAG: MBL fold metallo-hydrolase [Victivallaceae bacterium]